MSKVKYIVLYSGGHSSALVAVEAVRRFGKENVVLLNHDIKTGIEHVDIKRFKQEVSDYLDIPITYANMTNWDKLDPIDVCLNIGAWKIGSTNAICTYNMKSKPFKEWLKNNYPVAKGEIREDVIFLYGFDKKERVRITRRVGIMASMGYKTEFPLYNWERTITDIEEIGIERPITYKIYKHANCLGCLKAGRQQWFITYCFNNDLFEKAKKAEDIIGFSIIKGIYLKDLECKFKQMKDLKIRPSEKINPNTFWAMVRREFKENEVLPCDCSV